jgi:hypothetical protein
MSHLRFELAIKRRHHIEVGLSGFGARFQHVDDHVEQRGRAGIKRHARILDLVLAGLGIDHSCAVARPGLLNRFGFIGFK